jgi:FKBP-type peptidyl-prolyl cis-trans isomerase FkpA
MTPTRMVLLGLMMLAGAARAGEDETLYAMGAILGQRARGYGFSAKELARIERGFADAAAGRELKLKDRDLEEWGPRVDALLQKRGNPRIAAEKERGLALAMAEAKEPGAEKLGDGMVFRLLRAGEGENPRPTDRVRVKYEGRTADGKAFDSSSGADVPLDGVVRCWTLGVPRMKPGAKARLVCPSALAYGDQGRPPQVPAGGTVVFDIELLAVLH